MKIKYSSQTVQSAQTLMKFLKAERKHECLTAYAHFNRNINRSHGLPALYWDPHCNREPYNRSSVYSHSALIQNLYQCIFHDKPLVRSVDDLGIFLHIHILRCCEGHGSLLPEIHTLDGNQAEKY